MEKCLNLRLFYHWLTIGFGKSHTNLALSFSACEMELIVLMCGVGWGGVGEFPSIRMKSGLGKVVDGE